mmetsp:Transcript_29656/g.43775  ORF Transcript_29656/g.43775 Transcript_29656/m.43775 type:complete len:106 (-) Transcript_29656:1297-1614(-)
MITITTHPDILKPSQIQRVDRGSGVEQFLKIRQREWKDKEQRIKATSSNAQHHRASGERGEKNDPELSEKTLGGVKVRIRIGIPCNFKPQAWQKRKAIVNEYFYE